MTKTKLNKTTTTRLVFLVLPASSRSKDGKTK